MAVSYYYRLADGTLIRETASGLLARAYTVTGYVTLYAEWEED